MKVTAYDTYKIPTLSGGMVLSISNQLLEHTRGFSTMFKNLDPSMLGLSKKRPAVVLSSEGFTPGSGYITGLHYFKRQEEDKEYLVCATDTQVAAFDYEDESWGLIEDNLSNKFVYFITLADQLIYTNGVGTIRSWSDGLKSDLGARKASMRTYLLYANNDLKFTAKNPGETFIKVQYVKAASKTTSTSVVVSGSGTEEAPYSILVNLAWNDEKILSKASQVKSAIEAHSTAKTIVDVSYPSDSDGTREVTEMAERMLTGGYNAVKGKYLIEYRTRAVVADKNKLHVSHTGDPHLWSPGATGSNAMDVFVSPDDGEEISGLLNMGDGGILIGKPNSLYGLFGYKRDNFVVDLLDPSVGVSSHRTMIFSRPYAYWVWNTGVYRSQSGGTPERISYPIQELLDDIVDTNRIEESSALLYKRLYVLSLPLIGGGFVVVTFHLDHECWGLWTEPEGLVDVTVNNGQLIFAMRGLITPARFAEDVFIDEHTEEIISSEITTIELDLGFPENEKDIGDLYLLFRGTGNPFCVDIDVFTDGCNKPSVTARDVELSGNEGMQVVLRLTVGKTARFIQLSVRNNLDQQICPVSMSYTYQIKDVL